MKIYTLDHAKEAVEGLIAFLERIPDDDPQSIAKDNTIARIHAHLCDVEAELEHVDPGIDKVV